MIWKSYIRPSTLAPTTVKLLISLTFLPTSKVYQIQSFLTLLSALSLCQNQREEEAEMRKNYFSKLVRYMQNVYHLERSLIKLSEGRVNPTYSTGLVVLPVLFGFLLRIKALMN